MDLWVTDGNQAMLNALQLKFAASKRQRCIKHKTDNVLGCVPTAQQETVEPELKTIFYQDNREKADQAAAAFIEKYWKVYPKAIECLNQDLEACLPSIARTASALGNDSHDQCDRAALRRGEEPSHKMAAAFRNEDSCLLMCCAAIRGLKFRRGSMPAKEPGSALLHGI